MNIRWFALVLMMALIPGCSGRNIEAAPSEALYETKPTETVGFSSFCDIPGTGGALQAMALEVEDATDFRFLGNDILLFSGTENTVLTLIDPSTCTVQAEVTLPLLVSANDPCVAIGSEAITYMDTVDRKLVFLNACLEETGRISLPNGYRQGVLSSDQQFLYYCSADAVRVFEPASGIDRMLREMAFPYQEATGLHCDNTVLQCRITGYDGISYTQFLCAEDGRLLYETGEDISLWTDGDFYFSVLADGTYRELLTGSPDFGPSVLITETEPVALTPVPEQRIVLLHTQSPAERILLDAYHLETGKHIAQTAFADHYEILDIRPSPRTDHLWLLCHDRDVGTDMLCRWSLSQSDIDDPQNHLEFRWSSEHPDLDGISQCQEIAAELSEKHGIRIQLWTDVSELDALGYQTVPEYRVPLIRQLLRELDAALSVYPGGFLQELAAPTGSGRLNLCLVQHIYSDASPGTALPGILHWDNRGQIWLAAASDSDISHQINRLLCELIDSRVLGASNAYDSWTHPNASWGDHADRVRLLETALLKDQDDYFSSGLMQSNLRQLCLGIRETFQTAASADQLPWEQYLADIPQ